MHKKTQKNEKPRKKVCNNPLILLRSLYDRVFKLYDRVYKDYKRKENKTLQTILLTPIYPPLKKYIRSRWVFMRIWLMEFWGIFTPVFWVTSMIVLVVKFWMWVLP